MKRKFQEGERVIVASLGRYSKVDFKEGVITGYLPGGLRPRYVVFFPELDRSYNIEPTYLTSLDSPDEDQIYRYYEQGLDTVSAEKEEYRNLKRELRRIQKLKRGVKGPERSTINRELFSILRTESPEDYDTSLIDFEGSDVDTEYFRLLGLETSVKNKMGNFISSKRPSYEEIEGMYKD